MERGNNTKEQEYILDHMAGVFHTGVFCLKEDQCIPYEENPEYNPIYNNEALRLSLTRAAEEQKEPVLIRDEFHMIYICVRKDGRNAVDEGSCAARENVCYMMGPLSMQVMDRTERHRFYRFYGIDEKWEKGLHYHTLMEILQIAGLFAKIITGEEYTDQQLMEANYHVADNAREKQEQAWFDIKSEDEDIYRHSYQEERRIMDAVKEGNVTEAVRLSKEMDANIGRLGKSELEHWRNLSIYLEDIADSLGISSSYLSRLFKRETKISLQDFINDVRVEKAANLLVYSEETLPGIAEYVNFPSQSYFGKIFKQKMKMTPKQYRELHKPAEFYGGH